MPITLTLKEKPVEYRKMILTAIDFGGEDLPNVGALSAESIATTGDAEIGGDLAVTGEVAGETLDVESDAAIGGDLAVTGEVAGDSLDVTEGATIGGDLEVTGDVKGAALEVGGATGIDVILNDGAPNGSVLAKANSLCVDTTGHDVYINTGSAETPVWMKITRATE